MISRKSYLDLLGKFQDKPVIKVLTGLRRSGKSTLLKLMIERLKNDRIPASRILYIDKESLEFDAVRTYRDLQRLVTSRWKNVSGRKYLFVDEIQEIESWEKAIASLSGQGAADIYISGSNAHLLGSDLATLLSGRHIEIPVLSLTFEEFVQFRSAKGGGASVEENFSLFLKYGGLPGIHEFELVEDVVFQYLHSIFNTILYKDIVTRHKIRDTALLDRIARFSFDNCGNVTSAQKISEYMKSQRMRVATDTVLNYLAYLVSAFLLRRARRYDIRGKRHLEVNDKYYLGDIGLRHGFIGHRDVDIAGLLENVVYLELLHRGYSVSIGKLQAKEIDFVAEKGNEKLYIQVCYLLSDAKTEEREFAPLMEIADNHPKFVLSMDRDWGHGREGIHRVYLPSFLLKPQS
ncbi:MAG: ATP-binding protein [Acidobacteria bacterium]|nr:ATP-binding protein [Acidobacteriota bacterium]